MRSTFASLFSASLVVALVFAPSDGLAGPSAICLPDQTLTARGDGDLKEPTITEPTAPLPSSAKGKGANAKFRANIPVYFHVVSPDGVIGNVTDGQVADQVRVMNLAYSGSYGGVKTGFSFTLAGVTRTTNVAWFNAGPGSPDERDMKKALAIDPGNALNFYATTAGPYLGWAYLPGLPESRMYLDGVVVDWESMLHTSTRYEGRYDLGLTAVHESGHWFGLEHTFFGGCNAKGDFVADTPPMRVPTSGCPLGKDTCSEPGLDPIHNYMDYSYDACYFEFTAGQSSRMQDHFAFFRVPNN